MSNLRVTSLRGRTSGKSPSLPDGVVVTGVATATTTMTTAIIIATATTTATTTTTTATTNCSNLSSI